MNNLVTTVPLSHYKTWTWCEKALKRADGTSSFWLINTMNLPKKAIIGSVCYIVHSGKVRGYFDIIDTDLSENWRSRHGIGKKRTTRCIVMANWHPLPASAQPSMTGFQGWRYTPLSPLT